MARKSTNPGIADMGNQRGKPSGDRSYLAMISIIAALGGLLFGFDTAVVSGAVVYLKHQFALSAWMEGWVVSAALIGCLVGAASAGMFSDGFGRKGAGYLRNPVPHFRHCLGDPGHRATVNCREADRRNRSGNGLHAGPYVHRRVESATGAAASW